MTSYIVRAGDTLGKIARRFGVPVEAIVLLNRIENPDRIRAGQELTIPEATTDTMTAATVPVEAPPERAPAAGGPAINRTRFALPAKEFIGEVAVKDLVVLHFTAGASARSAYDSWMANPVRVATAYIVDPDGSIYETFDPAFWAFHLGVKGTSKHDRRSIGIEMANVGPLKPSPSDPRALNWWPNDWGQKWCTVEETGSYVKSSFRGIDFFASFPSAQVDAAAQLVRWLCERFGINKTIPPAARRMEFDAGYFAGYQGVAAHHNFRNDKWDTGPAFDWGRLGF
jgi:N-acetyl-anhydromuramyl-L-alanine amidase AmpD